MAAKKKEQVSALPSWDEIIKSLEASARGIDASALSIEDTERLFKSLPDDEAERIAEKLVEATEEIEDAKKLVAAVVDVISDIAGITLKLTA